MILNRRQLIGLLSCLPFVGRFVGSEPKERAIGTAINYPDWDRTVMVSLNHWSPGRWVNIECEGIIRPGDRLTVTSQGKVRAIR